MKIDLLHGSTVCFLSDFVQTSFESILSVVHYSGHADFSKHETRGEKIPVASSQGRKKNVLWCLIFVCLQRDTCFMSNLCTPLLEDKRCPRNLVVLSINLRKREVKNVQKIAPVHTLKICERLDGLLVQIHVFLTSELVESEWLGSSPNPLPAGGKELRANGIRCWVGTWEGTYALEKRKYLATLRGSNLISSVFQPITYRKKTLRKTKF